MSGGAGYVLSRQALKLFVERGLPNASICEVFMNNYENAFLYFPMTKTRLNSNWHFSGKIEIFYMNNLPTFILPTAQIIPSVQRARIRRHGNGNLPGEVRREGWRLSGCGRPSPVHAICARPCSDTRRCGPGLLVLEIHLLPDGTGGQTAGWQVNCGK